MRINERLLGYKIRYLFLFIDYILWLIFDFSKFKNIKTEKIKKVLIIHTGAIGELVMMSPIVKELSKKFNCRVDFLMKSPMFDLFIDNPYIGKLISYTNNFSEMLNELKTEKYDLAIIFQASFKNALLCYRANIPYRIGGFSRIKRFPTFLYTRRTFPTVLAHSLDYSFGMVSKIGVKKPSKLTTEIYVSDKSEKSAKKIINNYNLNNFALIHPGFGPAGKKSPPRAWQNEKYSEIADYLYDKFKLRVTFTGLKSEYSMINEIISKCKNKKYMVNLAGKTNLQEFCFIIKKSKLTLAPDTGASHIAASFEIPLVNLMDAPVKEWAPIGNKEKIINIHSPRELVLLENGKLFQRIGGVSSIGVEEVKKSINNLL